MGKNSQFRSGNALKRLIDDRKVNISEFADSIGVSRAVLYQYFSGQSVPGLDKSVLIASALGISLKDLAQSIGLDVSKLPDDHN